MNITKLLKSVCPPVFRLGAVGGVPVILDLACSVNVAALYVLAVVLGQVFLEPVRAATDGPVVAPVTIFAACLLLAVSVGAHEIGRCLMARQCGYGVRKFHFVDVFGTGHVTRPADGGSLGADLKIILGGMAGLALAAIAGVLVTGLPDLGSALRDVLRPATEAERLPAVVAVTGLIAYALALLPIYPLPGGRVLYAVSRHLLGAKPALVVTVSISILTTVIAPAALLLGMMFYAKSLF